LTPIERVWCDLKDDMAWRQFANLDAQHDYLRFLLRDYEAATPQSLTGAPSLVEAVHARRVQRNDIGGQYLAPS
jgi:hypothetical protein